ncbi:MAG TPA: sulfotransferase, partial [Steroidobacteraceae bacterium]|nr:sulfotransferase [Steroidobacteraceae bacterium]
CGRYEAAFGQYAAGNAVSRLRLVRYDRYAVEQGVSKLIESFDRARMDAAGPVSEAPLVFVTGMFRSGSTLFEQVLAAHPRVTAGGEIEYFMRVPISLDPADWQGLGKGYVDYLKRSFPGADIVTNKRPDAFGLLGMLKAVFPNARFVNTVRDPRDTALSIWFQQFDDRLGYAADLADIAHHYRQYRRLMSHWKGLFGECIFDADYDAYVQDPRGVTEKLLAFAGLDWHEGCLDFHRNANRVRTASVTQVREPLYQRSSGRWRNYERQLEPLALDLGGD